MPSTALDSDIFKDMFGTAEMRAVFSDDNLIRCYVDTEIALGVAQGRLGVIPQDAAEAIARLAPSVALDRDVLKHEAENVGYPILGLVRHPASSVRILWMARKRCARTVPARRPRCSAMSSSERFS